MLCLRSWNRTFPVSAMKFWTFLATESRPGGTSPPAARLRFEDEVTMMVRPVTHSDGSKHRGQRCVFQNHYALGVRRTGVSALFCSISGMEVATTTTTTAASSAYREGKPKINGLRKNTSPSSSLSSVAPARPALSRTWRRFSFSSSKKNSFRRLGLLFHAWAATFHRRQVSPLRLTLSQMDCFTRRGLGKTWASPGALVPSPEARPTLIRWTWAF